MRTDGERGDWDGGKIQEGEVSREYMRYEERALRLRAAREEMGLTQEKAAEILGVNIKTYADHERAHILQGQRSYNWSNNLAKWTATLEGLSEETAKAFIRRIEAGDAATAGRTRCMSLEMPTEEEQVWADMVHADHERPKTRADCKDGPRPCPWVGCRYNLYLDVTSVGSLKVARPGTHPWDMVESCALDLADRPPLPWSEDGLTLEEIGAALNVTRERVRQIEREALRKLRRYGLEILEEEQ